MIENLCLTTKCLLLFKQLTMTRVLITSNLTKTMYLSLTFDIALHKNKE